MAVLQRESTVDELVELLTRQILDGRYQLGSRLREKEIAARYGVSRNTLREALHRLARDGLVVHRPHRGVSVSRPDRVDVMEIYRLRELLETAALQEADASCVEDIAAIAKRMQSAAVDRDWERLVDLDTEFHARLVASIGSSRLDRFFEAVMRELRLSLVMVDSEPTGRAGPSHVPDHAAIASDLRAGRIAGARQRLTVHLQAAERLVLDHLSETQPADSEA